MTSGWRRLGRVYCADASTGWARGYAYCPTAFVRAGGNEIRVLCAFRDGEQVGRCGWVDVDLEDPCRVRAVSADPVLDVGRPGTFDEHGVTPLSIARLDDGRLRLYYAGWQRCVGVRYTLFTGIAESADDGESFQRTSEAPALDRSDGELHMRTGGHVHRDDAGWRMWYAGGSEWIGAGPSAKPRYALRHLRSPDGLRWSAHGEVCLQPGAAELGFGRPCALWRNGEWHMWYSRRALDGDYELGYAHSADGLTWARADDRAGLQRGSSGAWDAEMVGLACLLDLPERTLLFYNGNGYGRTGFGVAEAA